jgi:hypothetical protein
LSFPAIGMSASRIATSVTLVSGTELIAAFEGGPDIEGTPRYRVPVMPAEVGLRALHDGRGDFEDVALDVHNAHSLASNARLRSTPQR